jgi:hypothetical protein
MYPHFESFIKSIVTINGLQSGRPRNMGSILYSGRRVLSILTVLSRVLSKLRDTVCSGREIPVFLKSCLLPFLECLFSVYFEFLKTAGNEFGWHRYSRSLDSVPPQVESVIFRITLQEHCWYINVWHCAPRENSQTNNGYNTPTPRNVNHSMVTCEKTWPVSLLILIEMLSGKRV